MKIKIPTEAIEFMILAMQSLTQFKIFASKGTCLVPEQTFKGKVLDIQAGVAIPKAGGGYELKVGADPNSKYERENGGTLVGNDGAASHVQHLQTQASTCVNTLMKQVVLLLVDKVHIYKTGLFTSAWERFT